MLDGIPHIIDPKRPRDLAVTFPRFGEPSRRGERHEALVPVRTCRRLPRRSSVEGCLADWAMTGRSGGRRGRVTAIRGQHAGMTVRFHVVRVPHWQC